jgi:MFS family permease
VDAISRYKRTPSSVRPIGTLFAGSTLLTPLYVVYKEKFGFSQITLTLIYAIYVVGNLAALLLLGKLSDVIGRRRAAIAAVALSIISSITFLFATGTPALYLGRILSGLSIGLGAGTGTAWLTDLVSGEDNSRASMIATSSNFAGLGIGALVAGFLAEHAPWPLQLTFVVYAVALSVVFPFVCVTQETVVHRKRVTDQVSLMPRLSVPREIWASFVAPAVTGFGAMALVGFYAALAPSILAEQLHATSHLLAGAIFFEPALAVSVCILATQRLPNSASMLSALMLMPLSVAMVVIAQLYGSMTALVIATAICGVTAALGYRNSLQVVNEIAPKERRAEVASSYFICVRQRPTRGRRQCADDADESRNRQPDFCSAHQYIRDGCARISRPAQRLVPRLINR